MSPVMDLLHYRVPVAKGLGDPEVLEEAQLEEHVVPAAQPVEQQIDRERGAAVQ